jgi:hypothetical protein
MLTNSLIISIESFARFAAYQRRSGYETDQN